MFINRKLSGIFYPHPHSLIEVPSMNWYLSLLRLVGLCLLAAPALSPAAFADTTTCFPDNAAGHTGSVYGPTPQDSEIVAWHTPGGSLDYYFHEVGYARFNTSSIPEDVMILGVSVHFYVNTTSGNASSKVTPLELDPLVTDDYWIRWDISADSGPRYPYSRFTSSSPGWRSVDLGPEGIANFRGTFDENWFGVGFHNLISGVRIDGWAEANTPYIVVEHRPGPLTYHVDDDSPNDPGPGDPAVSDPLEDGSAAHPFDCIQEAVDAAYWEGAYLTEAVMVADGTYTGEGNRDITFDGKGVHVRSANGPDNCTIDCQGSITDPHRGFYFAKEGPFTVVEGFTITGGYAERGGAIYCSAWVGADYYAPVIRGNVITGNSAESASSAYGGGIYSVEHSSPSITGNVVTYNTVTASNFAVGGGIYSLSGSVTGNLITENRALSLYAAGGGVYSSGNVSDNIVSDNLSTYEGGGIKTSGEDILLSNNIVFGNTAQRGGGIHSSPRCTISNCTVTGNTATLAGGGLFLEEFSTITDSIVEGNESANGNEIYFDWQAHLVDFSDVNRAANDIYEASGAVVTWGPGVIDTDPGHVTGSNGDYYLSQLMAGQPVNSACIDAGSAAADTIQIPVAWNLTDGTTAWTLASERTTATNFVMDAGTVDMGFHYPVQQTVISRLDSTSTTGILPFSTQFSVTLENTYTGQTRQVAARLDVDLASGASFPNWRSGWANIDAGSSYTTTWGQSIPALPTLVGMNVFTLHAWDVTPAPYNQPPYPAAGDSDSDMVVVTGVYP